MALTLLPKRLLRQFIVLVVLVLLAVSTEPTSDPTTTQQGGNDAFQDLDTHTHGQSTTTRDVTEDSIHYSTERSILSNRTSNDEHANKNDNGLLYQSSNNIYLWTKHKESYTSEGKRLDGHTFLIISGKKANTQCALECLKHSQCKSFNFYHTTGMCELNEETHSAYPNGLTDVVDVEYHLKEAYSINEEALGPCLGDPCSGHGRCLETRSVSGDLMALCLCDDGWRGTACNLIDAGPQWAEWTRWSACSVTCQVGWRMRKRNCEDSNTLQTLNPLQCYGASQEYGACQMQDCPKWDTWGEWEGCSSETTCGRGIKVRRRTCLNGGTIGIDRYCLGLDNETTPCMSVECNGPIRLSGGQYPGEGRVELFDDIRGNWTLLCADQMTDFVANLACKQAGWPGSHASINDNRFGLGRNEFGLTSLNCKGTEKTMAACPHNHWTEGGNCNAGVSVPGGVQCNVNGVWTLWSSWSDCSVSCENGTRTRTRQCNHPPTMHSGRPCQGDDIQYKACTLPMCPLDGEWNSWLEWSACSETCGNGTQLRNRTCDGPFYGGLDCVGEDEEIRWCKDRECPIDGVWDPWALWSECSLTCGNGIRTRNRTCHGPFYDGNPCNGSADTQEACNTFHCPVDGEWQQWESWGECSTTCGGGEQNRVRQCQQPLHGGATCDGEGEEVRDCNEHDCPIDGIWNMWSDWSDCSVTCSWGWQWRNRTCEGPYHLGAPCEGEDNQTQACRPRECPVDGEWMDWESWSDCTVSCGGGTRDRFRECYLGQYGGSNCTGSSTASETCNDHACPVDGVWQAWTEWGECSLTCGNGSQWRSRDCLGPFYNGANCSGPFEEEQACNTHNCPVDGVFEIWSQWEICSLTCGGGQRSRSRNCTGPFYGGANCVGDWNENEVCSSQPCPVDGNWRHWVEWSECTVTCGGGTRERDRQCDFALHGGDNCTGPTEQNETCSTHHCPVDGTWEQWSNWDICSVTCDGGRQSRYRNCTGPFYGGQDCEPPWNETQDCNTHNCPEDGILTSWSPWSACDVTCGGGVKERNRTCTGPFYGGKDCEEALTDNSTCNTHECPIDGIFMAWAEWSVCSTSCGGGVSWRSRNCSGPFYGGQDCIGAWEENKTCNEHPCPEDGAWMPWSVWDVCSVTCGGGEQSRDRVCNGTMYGGKYCEGDHNQTQQCNTHECPVDGIFSPWEEWNECSLTCGTGSQQRNRSCIGPFFGGRDCDDDYIEIQNCNEHPCPIDGYYTNWSEWEECSTTCGGGLQDRDRTCIQPLYGGADCLGPSNETRTCNEHNCPVDGYYGEWADWSECSVTCGGGSQWKNRTCEQPLYGGQDCQGPDNVTQDCNTQPCPIDGEWLPWSEWTPCNTTCGGGLKERTRECQEPQYGGSPCEGVTEEYLSCSENPCPIPGEWFPWTPWTSCTVTCNGGTRNRQRECDMTSFQELTAPCEGPDEEIADCHTFDCLPLARTCTELGQRGLMEDTIADIDPDGPGITTLEPVVVYCDMTEHNGVGVTVIGHDQEDRHQVQGWEGAREYEVELQYNISYDHVISIVDQSGYCEQYISWECFAALIHNHNDNFKVTTGWLNRTRGIADYFGGAPPGSHSCACGMNNTCVEETYVCNCDSNDNIWRQDDGYLTYKDDLPVFAFVAGDTGDWLNEEGYFTVGPVLCYGKDSPA